MSAKKSKKKNGGGKWWKWALILLAFPVLGILILTFLLFGRAPAPLSETPQIQDGILMGKLTGRFMSEFMSARPPGRPGRGGVEMPPLPETPSELILSPSEVNSLLRISRNGTLQKIVNPKAAAGPVKNQQSSYDAGYFDVLAPYDTGLRWLWGGYLNIDMQFKAEKEDDTLKLDITRLKLGSLPMPEFIVRRVAERTIGEARRHKDYEKFNRSVRRIWVDDNHYLHIVYLPGEVQKALNAK